jgi:hypothetical protein
VLRFFGYFLEAVTESNIENHRVRRVVVMYYLADDSMQVTEPKQDNSGIPQVHGGCQSLETTLCVCVCVTTCVCALHSTCPATAISQDVVVAVFTFVM